MSTFPSLSAWAGHRRPRSPGALPARLPLAALLAALFTTLSVQAQAPAQAMAAAAGPDPLDAKASVPALRYESSLATYRRLGDSKPLGWRDANDAVTRKGGWRTYAREAQQPEPEPATAAKPAAATPPAQPTEPASPMPHGHGGHKRP